jgi:hypothetical protein
MFLGLLLDLGVEKKHWWPNWNALGCSFDLRSHR